MSVQFEINDENHELVIHINGILNHAVRKEFIAAYENMAGGVKRCVLDLEGLSYIDSTGFGMLIMLKDFANKQSVKNLAIRHCNAEVEHLLTQPGFNDIFTFE